MKRVVSYALIAVLALGCVFALFLPLPQKPGRGEIYACIWEDGGTTHESYASAYADLVGINEAGNLSLLRGGEYGEIQGSADLRAFLAAAESTDESAILALSADTLTGLESAAVNLHLKARLWYADGFYAWTGEKIARTDIRFCRRLVVLSGELPADAFILSGAEELVLASQANALEALSSGHSLQEISADAPYSMQSGVLYLDTAGGRRLIAVLASVTELSVEDVNYIDRGALLACTRLVSLDLPFVGSALNGIGINYDGMLAHLFSMGEQYEIPETLAFVRVRGGTLISHAFYRFKNILEIDACGVKRDKIATDAFIDCVSLLRLHTPKANVLLPAAFTSHVAACGCTVYERLDEI